MTRDGNYVQMGFRPGAMQVPGAHNRTNDIVPALNDDSGDLANPANILDQIIAGTEEGIVHEVVTFDPSESQCEFGVAKLLNHRRIEKEFRGAALPDAPGARGFQTNSV